MITERTQISNQHFWFGPNASQMTFVKMFVLDVVQIVFVKRKLKVIKKLHPKNMV